VTAPRIWIVGCSGAGKTTLARRLAADLSILHLELDGVFHQADWTPLPRDEFRARVAETLDGHRGWVACGNYNQALGDVVVSRANTVLWLDPPKRVVMTRLLLRTLRRTVTRETLWNGNRERWTNLTSWDPHKSILRWGWTEFSRYRARYEAASTDGSWHHATVHRLRSAASVDAFVAGAPGLH